MLARLVPPVLPRGAARVADVTLDHLLTHTSGGWPPVFDPMFTRPALPLPLLVTETLASRPLTAPPGTVWAYSNFGYALLGLVIEAVTGQPYAQAVAGRLGMTVGDNGFAVAGDGAGSAPGEAAYVSAEMDPQALPMARLTAVGGWIAAAPVLARALAGIDGAGADIVPRAVPAMMARPWQAGAGYGRGLILNPAHGNRWHDGSLPGTTAFAVLVDGGDVMVALANGRTPDSLLAMETMLWTLYLDG